MDVIPGRLLMVSQLRLLKKSGVMACVPRAVMAGEMVVGAAAAGSGWRRPVPLPVEGVFWSVSVMSSAAC